jgi:spore coat protein A
MGLSVNGLVAGVCGMTLWVAGAFGATATLTAVKDATIYADNTSNANGAGIYMHVGSNAGGAIRRALVQFDLASIPAGSTITAATLTLYGSTGASNNTASTSIQIRKLTQSWSEGTGVPPSSGGSGMAAVAGNVTWNRRTYNTTSWTNPGGTYSGTVTATASVPEASGARNWTGAQVLADVQGWYTNSATNFGWILIGDEDTDQTARRFSTRQNATVAERPKLVITYTPPATSGACCNPNSGACNVTSSPVSCLLAGNNYWGNGTTCAPNPCPQPEGACCTGLGSCTIADQVACEDLNRYWQGANTVCSPNPCPVLSGACCHDNATCTFVNALACAFSGNGAAYQGDNVTCVAAACNWVLTPFTDPLPIPSVAVPTTGTAGGAAHYNMFIRQFSHQFHSQLPSTTVWGYNDQYPGPTIEARQNLQVTTTWINDLRVNGPASALRNTHVLTVDTCLHGPDVTGRVPVTVTHLHGAHLRPDSDGDPDTAFGPGQTSSLYDYPNNQHAATLWYHDHALGITRLNVYMGLAGFYLIRDAIEDALDLPRGHNEVPLVIQDRSFTATGALQYNSTFTDHFFGDFAVVNGKVWPYLDVRQGKYRFRIVNGSTTRTWTLRMQGPPSGAPNSVPAWQIGSDLGLLKSPVSLGGGLVRPTSVTVMPGERVEIVVDFAGYAAGTHLTLVNTAVVPFPGGGDGPPISNVMEFRVTGVAGHTAALPATLKSVPRTPEAEATVTRDFKLSKVTDTICNHDMWLINQLMWDDITDFPKLGDTEIWRWINQSGLSHPMHIHLVEFQVLDRQDFTVGGGGEIIPTGSPILPNSRELGWKDTVQATPNQITRVIARFTDYPGTFPFHCHILDHEDHEMMRQFTVECKPLSVLSGIGGIQVSWGQTTTISAVGTGSPPFTYQWRRNNVPLVNGPTAWGSTISGATTAQLQIINTRPNDAGNYNCLVTNPCGVSATSPTRALAVFCPADFNHSGTLEVADIFDFLNAWFAGAHAADFNNSGTLEVQDIFDFLNAWFAGC